MNAGSVAAPAGGGGVGLQGRMNSLQQLHEVRLRGLGGPDVCGVSGTGASATGALDRLRPGRLKPRLQSHEVRLRGLGGPDVCGVPCTGASATNPRRRISRSSSGEFIRSWCGPGGPDVCGVPRTGASATNPRRRILRSSSGEFIRSWCGVGGSAGNRIRSIDFLKERRARLCARTTTGARPKDLLSAARGPESRRHSSPRVLPARSFGRHPGSIVMPGSARRLPQEITRVPHPVACAAHPRGIS
jgi:hypothetical protein